MPGAHLLAPLGETFETQDITFQADFVSLHALDCLLEKAFVSSRGTRDVVLLPFDRCIDVLENFLDGVRNFGADTVAGYLNER